MGVVMMTGIMAIFEMGLSLTGQSVLPTPVDAYSLSPRAKALDQDLFKLLDKSSVVSRGLSEGDLCAAISKAYTDSSSLPSLVLTPIGSGSFEGGCQIKRDFIVDGDNIFHGVYVESPGQADAEIPYYLPYNLFSCTSDDVNHRCSFERE